MATACVDASYDKKALEGLLDAFGASFSLKEIASAYCQAGNDADLAAELLYKSNGNSPSSATWGSSSDGKGEDSFEGSYVMVHNKSHHVNYNVRKTKQIGTVSGHLSKDYVSSRTLTNGSSWKPKPVEVKSQSSQPFRGDPGSLGYEKKDPGLEDMENFLFKLLGVGFQLDRSQIQTVLGQCGYDIQKSMHQLLDISVRNLNKGACYNTGSIGKNAWNSSCTLRHQSENPKNYGNEDIAANENETGWYDSLNSKIDREMEILAALFSPSERIEELPKRRRPVKEFTSSKADGELVDFVEVEVSDMDEKTDTSDSQKDEDDYELESDNFQILRKAVQEYLATKKEYYRAAVEAHAEGDHARAAKFLEQGEFFHQKAREADEESTRKIFEIRPNVKTHDTLTLDLHDYDPKDATRLLKCHLSTLSAFKHLKLIVETDDKDTTKGSRRRRIMKLLKEESIQWTEGSEPGTILISTDKVDPTTLSSTAD